MYVNICHFQPVSRVQAYLDRVFAIESASLRKAVFVLWHFCGIAQAEHADYASESRLELKGSRGT